MVPPLPSLDSSPADRCYPNIAAVDLAALATAAIPEAAADAVAFALDAATSTFVITAIAAPTRGAQYRL